MLYCSIAVYLGEDTPYSFLCINVSYLRIESQGAYTGIKLWDDKFVFKNNLKQIVSQAN